MDNFELQLEHLKFIKVAAVSKVHLLLPRMPSFTITLKILCVTTEDHE